MLGVWYLSAYDTFLTDKDRRIVAFAAIVVVTIGVIGAYVGAAFIRTRRLRQQEVAAIAHPSENETPGVGTKSRPRNLFGLLPLVVTTVAVAILFLAHSHAVVFAAGGLVLVLQAWGLYSLSRLKFRAPRFAILIIVLSMFMVIWVIYKHAAS